MGATADDALIENGKSRGGYFKTLNQAKAFSRFYTNVQSWRTPLDVMRATDTIESECRANWPVWILDELT